MSVVFGHSDNLFLKFSINFKERQDKLPTIYWSPKLQEKHIKQALSLVQALVPLLNFLNYYFLALLLLKLI